MLYLEDYLEMIEHLPQELRDRFTEMREMDLSVQNNMDSLEKRIRMLFGQCRRGELPPTQSDNEFGTIRKDYYKVLEDADEKVQLASQMYDLVERYLRKLDSELYKFKCELEADHNGITEILEKRSLELDQSTNSSSSVNQKENRYFGAISSSTTGQSQRERKHPSYKYKPEKRRDSTTSGPPPEKRQAISSGIGTPTVRPSTPNLNHHAIIATTPTTSNVPYSGQHIVAADKAIAAAASQAIVATQQGIQGRRTASFKSSYEAINGNLATAAADLLIGREMAGAAHNAIQAVEREGTSFGNRNRPNKKKLSLSTTSTPSTSSSSSSLQSSQIVAAILPSTPTLPQTPDPPSSLMSDGLVTEQTPDGEWSYDPNEPRYCICNQVSYGDMVACDNEDCPFEWFHYPCVGITQSPKGKWYCPQCTSSMRRRGSRKN